jgi:hypothetical protein
MERTERIEHPHLRPRGVVLLVGAVGVVAALLLAACSSSKPQPSAAKHGFNPLSSTTTSTLDPHALHLPDGFQKPDTRFVSIEPVVSHAAAVPIPVRGGHASVTGTVTGPTGPGGGATVRIERWVGAAHGTLDVIADGNGRFGVGGLLGGHYSVRAWLQPSLSTFNAATGFVVDGGVFNATVTMQQSDATTVQVAASTGAVQQNVPFSVIVLVTKQQVDANGVVQTAPVNGIAVNLAVDGGLDRTEKSPLKTAANGLISWTVTCTAPGDRSVTATTKDGVGALKFGCQASSTPHPSGPKVKKFPVGSTFTVPDPGVYPAGVYETGDTNCQVTWQAWVDGSWQDGQSQGFFLTLPGPGRNFAAAQGSKKNCTYERIS